jgi:3,4-dehydroadipyl-CoA semialdehyde dehydrogenase
LLKAVVDVLNQNKAKYYEIAQLNSGTTTKDSAVDIEGAIFTLSTFAKLGAGLGEVHLLEDGASASLSKDGLFKSQHFLSPNPGLALFINAFNFPAWGLWEKAAPALLSGVPVVIKPATSTAWLTHAMVEDVIAAKVLPIGSLSIICGSSRGLLDALESFDVVSFTGSAKTAEIIRSHPLVCEKSIRLNIEADSLNSALLDPSAQAGSGPFDALIGEVVREMSVKSGQKCTAIRRIFVHQSSYEFVSKALVEKLKKINVGNPSNESVRMGSLVSHEQKQSVLKGIEALSSQVEVLYDGNDHEFIDVSFDQHACVAPVLLGAKNLTQSPKVNEVEVFGPVATLIAYESIEEAFDGIEKGEGSLVMSIYSDDPGFVIQSSARLGSHHGRIHVVSSDVASLHTGHGNVMPMSLHGGPARAGGGEELGGLRALNFYHRRTALQASATMVDELSKQSKRLEW